MRRHLRRLSLALAVVVLGVLELHSFTQAIGSQARIRGRVLATIRSSIGSARPRLGSLIRSGGEEAWASAIRDCLESGLADEAEVLDVAGRRLRVEPSRPSPVKHWPSGAELEALKQGAMTSAGPFLGGAARLLTYVAFPSGQQVVVLRLFTPVPELLDDLRERRQLLLGHGVALALLVLAFALAVFPERAAEAEAVAPAALGAYEAAMASLRDKGQTLSLRHERERRRLEQLLEDREALARAGELTAGIVHEVRNGLATILGYARLVETGTPAPERAAQAIREECETLEGVARRFMDFARRETLKLEDFDLRRLLSRAVARESRSRAVAEVALAGGEPVALVGDEELLERAFENLVRNALEAAGPTGRVEIEVGRAGDGVRVGIADDGPGLPAETGSALRPFFTTKPGGLGLGLPIAFKVVGLHQGTLELLPRSPRGLLVAVTLPAQGPRPDGSAVTSGSDP